MPYASNSKLDKYLGKRVTIPSAFMENGRDETGVLGKNAPDEPEGGNMYYVTDDKGEFRTALGNLNEAQFDKLVSALDQVPGVPGGRRKSRRLKKRRATRRAKKHTRRSRSSF